MPTSRTPRAAWVTEGLEALAAGGPETVKVEAIARALGVSKGGFYWHFDDRAALLEEVLDTWERRLVDDVITDVEHHDDDARAKLRRLSGLASDDAASIDLAVRDWARHDQSVAERLRRVDNRRMAYMRSLFSAFCDDEDEIEVRCIIAFSLWIGTHLIAADHGERTRAEMRQLVIERLLK